MGKDVVCPACDSEILLDGSEKVGDQVYCGYCSLPFKVTQMAEQEGSLEVEEDY